MTNFIEKYFIYFVILQTFHSQEEIWTGFEKVWPVWKMSRRFFIICEVLLTLFLLIIIFWRGFPGRTLLMLFYNLLMFANGIWHLMWAASRKKYVPGLVTAPIFILLFLIFYFGLFEIT